MTDAKNKREQQDLPTHPCPVCGNSNDDFTWGMPVTLYFKPDTQVMLTGSKEESLRMRKCNQCNNVLFFTQK